MTKYFLWRHHHVARQVWGKEEKKLEEEEKDQGRSSVIIDFSLLIWCQEFRVRSRFFSQPFAKLRALLMAEMIDKREESMEAHKRRVMNLKKRDTDICFGKKDDEQ